MNHLCNIQQKVETQDTVTGVVTEAWTTFYGNVPCTIEAVSVKDFIQSQAIQAEVTARVKIPFIEGVTASMRVQALCGCHAGRLYNIVGVLEDNITSREYLTLPCNEGVNEG